MTAKRAQRSFNVLEKAALLKALGECRSACLRASNHALSSHKDVHAGCAAVESAIDDLAGILTGSRQHFWGKSHSSASYFGAKES